jgi:putative ABC transport system substrate-binding protein
MTMVFRLLVLLVCLTAWSGPADAQSSPGVRRVGVLVPNFNLGGQAALDPLRLGMREAGWVEGRDYVAFLYEHELNAEALIAAINALSADKVEVVVLITLQAAAVVRVLAPTLPIVVLGAADPVASGVAETLARPGGMITGLTIMAPELLAKRVALLKEMVPTVSRLAVMLNPRTPASPLMAQATVQAAEAMGMSARLFEASTLGDIDGAFGAVAQWRADAVIILDDLLFYLGRREAIEAALLKRLPLVCPAIQMTRQGCLFSYATHVAHQFRRAGLFVDKILKGEKPGDLPFEQPTRFGLVINLKTAAALSLDIPPTLLSIADEVIE